MAYFINEFSGLKRVDNIGDGTSIKLDWYTAYKVNPNNKLAYTIYYSNNLDNLYFEGIKYLYTGLNTNLVLTGFNAGDLIYFAIRAYEYNPTFDMTNLVLVEPNLYTIPQSLLSFDINNAEIRIPLMDTSEFPNFGTILIGSELIQYWSKTNSVLNAYQEVDSGNNGIITFNNNIATFISPTLNNVLITQILTISNATNNSNNGNFEILSYNNGIITFINSNAISENNVSWKQSDSGRGFQNTIIRPHSVDGTDTSLKWLFYRQGASLWIGSDEIDWDKHQACEIRFDYPNYPNNQNGYRQKIKDISNVDLTQSDEYNKDFPSYDYVGYHRQDPKMLLEGSCLGTYQGGEMFCQDDEGGVGRVLRGVPMQYRNNQRQEMLLRLTGYDCVLLQRRLTGIVCKCVFMYNENPDPQCEVCLGSGYVHGYVQYFNPRNSDGRLKLRFQSYKDVVKLDEQGFDAELQTSAWTLTIPTIKQRDIIIKYDKENNEEFRYEVLGVERNSTFLSLMGDQKLDLGRIRKTEPIYKVKIFSNTATMPIWADTSGMISISPSIPIPQNIMAHNHQFRKNEQTSDKFIQNSTVDAGHNHEILFITSAQFPDGRLVVMPILNHTHSIT